MTKTLLALISILFVCVLVLLYLNLNKPQPVIVQYQPIPTTTPIFVDWKIYQNTQYGFEVSYPSSFTIIDNNDNGRFTGIKDNMYYQVIKDNSPTIADYLVKADKVSQTAWEGYPSIEVLETKKTVINGLNCIQRKENQFAAGFTALRTYFKKGNIIVIVSLISAEGNLPDSDFSSKLLSTFKFVTPSPCGSCPQLMPPAPDFCKGGSVRSEKTNSCGCSLGPECVY